MSMKAKPLFLIHTQADMPSLGKGNIIYLSYKFKCRLKITTDNYRVL